MPQITHEEFERLPLRVHAFLAGVPLHDAWAVDLPYTQSGITLTEFIRRAGMHACGIRISEIDHLIQRELGKQIPN